MKVLLSEKDRARFRNLAKKLRQKAYAIEYWLSVTDKIDAERVEKWRELCKLIRCNRY